MPNDMPWETQSQIERLFYQGDKMKNEASHKIVGLWIENPLAPPEALSTDYQRKVWSIMAYPQIIFSELLSP